MRTRTLTESEACGRKSALVQVTLRRPRDRNDIRIDSVRARDVRECHDLPFEAGNAAPAITICKGDAAFWLIVFADLRQHSAKFRHNGSKTCSLKCICNSL